MQRIVAFLCNNSSVVIISCLTLLIGFVVGKTTNHMQKKGYLGFGDVYLIVFLLVVFGGVVVWYLKIDYDLFIDTVLSVSTNPLEFGIANMQANTLAVATIVVTISGIVITALTLYRERKADVNNVKIEEELRKLAETRKMIHDLADISAIQFMGTDEREYYYDTILRTLHKSRSSKEETYYSHYRISEISILSTAANMITDNSAKMERYNEILLKAEEVINDDNAEELEINFAYREALDTLYKKICIQVGTCPAASMPDIKKAFNYLNHLSHTSDDTFGYIDDLYGLVYLWSGIAQIRMNDKKPGIKHIYKSIGFFERAIEKQPQKREFLNNRVVAFQQLFDHAEDVAEKDRLPITSFEIGEKLDTAFDVLIEVDKNHYLTKLNKAGYLIRKTRKDMGFPELDSFPDYNKYLKQSYDESYIEKARKNLEDIQEIKQLLMTVQATAPQCCNGFYKMCEAISIELVLNTIIGSGFDAQPIKTAEQCIRRADEIDNNSIGNKYCKWLFYSITNNVDKAEAMKNDIQKQKNVSKL